MIKLTRLNDKEVFINPDLIENMETYPDTIITLTTANKITVKEKPEEIIQKIIDFKASILSRYEKKS
jgi:flagellar protein FlbD